MSKQAPQATPRDVGPREPEVIAAAIDVTQAQILTLMEDSAKGDLAHQAHQDLKKLEDEYRLAMHYGPSVQLYT